MRKKEKAGGNRPDGTNERERVDLTLGYCRVSTHKQLDDGVSVEAQGERIGHYAAARDLGEPMVLTDCGSGKSLNREQWEYGMRLIRRGVVRHLIVYKLDRLSRSLGDLIVLAEALQRHSCELHVIAENVSTDNSSGRLFFHILGALAQWTRENIAENTRTALRYKRERGEYTGGHTVYGYRAVPTGRFNRAGREIRAVVEDEAEMAVCGQIMAMKRNGFGVVEIQKRLTAQGVVNRTGNALTRKQVYRVLLRMRGETVLVEESCAA